MHTNFALLISGLILSMLSLPLAMKWVGPNPVYGVRIQRTLHNEQLWFRINSFGGWILCIVALVGIALSLFTVPIGQLYPKLDWLAFMGSLLVALIAITTYAYRAT